jgi:hypothetical protein
MATNTSAKGHVVDTTKQLIVGATKHFATGTTVSFAGGSYTPDQVAQKLQSLVDLRSNVDAAKATVRATLALEAAQAPALTAFSRQFKAFVKATFVNSPDVLADFGISLKQRGPMTVEEKTAAVAKRAATRAARHTMGVKQKLDVKGDVTGVVITPVKASGATVPTPTSPTAPATGGSPTATSSPTAPATGGSPTATSSPTAPATSGSPTATTTQHTA